MRRVRRDRGAVVVEFALVAPLLFLLIFGLADFALAELSDAAGANAAREGARVGILHYDGAHVPGATNNTKIVDAVNAKLAGNVAGAPSVVVRCVEADGSPRPSGGSCSTVLGDAVDVGSDLIEVTVSWSRKNQITPFASMTRTDRVRMRIVGEPPTGASPPAACAITTGTASPASVVLAGSTIPSVTFDASVNDLALCGSPLVSLPAQSGYAGVQSMTSSGPTTFTFTMDGSIGTWTTGGKTATVTANGGAATLDIAFTVQNPTVCQITSAGASPPSVSHTGGTLSSAITFAVAVSDAAVCGTPSLTFPPVAGYGGPQAMSSTGTNTFGFTMPTSQGAGAWSAQTYTINAAVAGGGGDSAAIDLIVSAAPTCSLSGLSITPGTASVKKTGQKEIQTTVTIRVTRSSLTVCAVPTVTVTPGDSGQAPLTSPQSMVNVGTTTSCSNLTCEWVIPSGDRDWMPAPSTRTVTVTASGSTVTGSLNLS